MVYFWFGWNNRMGVSGGRVDAVLGREQDRTGTGTGSWDLEYREKLVGVRGNHCYTTHPSILFRFFPLFPLAIWTSVGTCECPASFPPSSPDIGPQTQQRQPFAPPPLPQRISEDRILNTAQTGSTPTSKRRKMARCKHKLPPQHVGVCRRSNWVQGGGEDDVASGVRPRTEASVVVGRGRSSSLTPSIAWRFVFSAFDIRFQDIGAEPRKAPRSLTRHFPRLRFFVHRQRRHFKAWHRVTFMLPRTSSIRTQQQPGTDHTIRPGPCG